MMRLLAVPVVAVFVAASLVACGGNDKPAVCDSVDTLKSAVTDLKGTDFTSSDGVSSLQSQLTTVKGDLDDVTKDAKSQFATQTQAVDTAYTALQSSVATAKSSPSAANLAAVGAAVAGLLTAAQTLVTDIQATC